LEPELEPDYLQERLNRRGQMEYRHHHCLLEQEQDGLEAQNEELAELKELNEEALVQDEELV
jgi:hypothetical protein